MNQQDFKTLLEQVNEKRAIKWEKMDFSSQSFAYKSGAQLPTELLLLAIEALEKEKHALGWLANDSVKYEGTDASMFAKRSIKTIDETLNQIRARLESELGK